VSRSIAAAAPEVGDPPEQREVLRTLVAAQVLSGAGLAAGITVGALLAEDMLDSDSLAGVPAALFTVGSAGAAAVVGRVSNARGRRWGLGLGYATGAAGAALIVLAASLGSVALLLPALLVYGAGTATSLQARYAGADLAAPDRRGRAVSTVLVATTVGAVIGPNITSTMGDLADGLGLPELAGPFLLAAVAYGLAGAVLLARLRPDPLLLARERAGEQTTAVGHAADAPARVERGVVLGGLGMVAAQLVMVAVMTMTPVHMKDHGHGLGAAGAVIAAHVAGMYLLSPVTGRLVDRLGARVVAAASAATLATAGVLAAIMPTDSVPGLAVALAVLGIGWNLGLVSGTAIVTDAVPLAVRARTQGAVDLCVALAGAGGGLGSGAVVAATSYATLAVGGAVVALLIVPVVAVAARLQVEGRLA
jgi:MFS family permease